MDMSYVFVAFLNAQFFHKNPQDCNIFLTQGVKWNVGVEVKPAFTSLIIDSNTV